MGEACSRAHGAAGKRCGSSSSVKDTCFASPDDSVMTRGVFVIKEVTCVEQESRGTGQNRN